MRGTKCFHLSGPTVHSLYCGRVECNSNNSYSQFQVTFQSSVAKVVLNIPNYITKFGILRGNLLSQFASC